MRRRKKVEEKQKRIEGLEKAPRSKNGYMKAAIERMRVMERIAQLEGAGFKKEDAVDRQQSVIAHESEKSYQYQVFHPVSRRARERMKMRTDKSWHASTSIASD